MRKAKYDGEPRPRRLPGEPGAIEKFDAAARARGMTYAEAQVEETGRLFCKRTPIPPNYSKVGERISKK